MISITEMTIAARLSGMDYGKFVHLMRHGFVTLPSMAEIRKQMVTIKTAVPQVSRPNTPVIQYSRDGERIANGEAFAEIATDYPTLTADDLEAIKGELSKE